MKTLFIFLSLASFAFTEEDFDSDYLYEQTPPEEKSFREIQRDSEINLYKEALIPTSHSEDNLIGDPHYTQGDVAGFSIAGQIAPDYDDFAQIQSFELGYRYRWGTESDFWITAMFKLTQGDYDALADERSGSSGDALITRGQNTQTFNTFGLGGGYRFRAFADLFSFERVFETSHAYITYSQHDDGTNSQNYSGFGLMADYSLNYRASRSFFYGLKMSYNWRFMERVQEGSEPLSDRTLIFGWTSFGLEIGYIY